MRASTTCQEYPRAKFEESPATVPSKCSLHHKQQLHPQAVLEQFIARERRTKSVKIDQKLCVIAVQHYEFDDVCDAYRLNQLEQHTFAAERKCLIALRMNEGHVMPCSTLANASWCEAHPLS